MEWNSKCVLRKFIGLVFFKLSKNEELHFYPKLDFVDFEKLQPDKPHFDFNPQKKKVCSQTQITQKPLEV